MSEARIAKTWGERERLPIRSLREQQGGDPPDFGLGVRVGGTAERRQGGFGPEGGERRGRGLPGRRRGKLHRLEQGVLALLVVHPRQRGGEDRSRLVVRLPERVEDALDS